MLCPEIIGRGAEVEWLRRRVVGLADRHGGVVALVGEAGVGKSRLFAEAIVPSEVFMLTGRAMPGDSPVPYRPLAEALLAALRGRQLPRDPSLEGFEGQLARLVPGWATSVAADESPVLLGEAVVRLLAILADGRGCVLVLEDLQWADPETLAVVDYLADALRTEPTLCVCTSRPAGLSVELLERLDRRHPADVLRVRSLGEAEIARMLGSCLGTTEPPAGLTEFVREHSDGSPFLVEELLAGLVAARALRCSEGSWEITGPLNPAVPASLRASIKRRLDALDAVDRRVLGAAALLGRQFEWELLPGIAEVDGRATIDALRAAVDEQFIEPEGDGFRFRHALTREAVLDDLLPPERRQLAARAWPVIERANPGLPGSACQLAANLAEAAGDSAGAASRLTQSARRALTSGALATAESTARRACRLAEADPATELDATEVLVDVLAAAGKSADALALGHPLVERLAAAGAASSRRADLLVTLVRAALAAGDLGAADKAASGARDAAGTGAEPALVARIDAIAAELALDRVDLVGAERLCRRAIQGARATDQPGVVCAALLVLGRAIRPQGLAGARRRFQEAADVAERAGLPRWHLRAQQELALDLAGDSIEQVELTRDLAARYGAHITVAAMNLGLADVALAEYHRDDCLQAATACVEASRRYRLATEPVAQLWLAGAHALGGDDEAMQQAVDAALDRDAHDPRILGDLYGRVLATRAFVRDELGTLPGLLDEMIGHVRLAPPTTSVYPGRVAWALLHTADDDDHGAAARAEYHAAADRMGIALFDRFGEVIEAVALGRVGDSEAATALIGPALDELLATPIGRGMARALVLLVAVPAIRDNWGDPACWLRDAEAWFAERGYDRMGRRARILLGEAGAPVPRRGRGNSEVPPSLRSLGVTSREVDVLKLIVAGRPTKEIATELYLSPKTIERHLTSLFNRTGVRNRYELAELGVVHLA